MSNQRGLLAIIGGTGLADCFFEEAEERVIETRWGVARVFVAPHPAEPGQSLVFLHRHAGPTPEHPRHLPPHRINYRANIAALKKLGVTGILAGTAVGCLRREWPVGSLVLLDQFIDCTTNRPKTFYDDHTVHIDVTEPYCDHLRGVALQSAADFGISLHDGGTYLCTDGPRFESPAEIRAYTTWGADLVGMTGLPEAVLAREANISYAGVSIVTNAAAGILPQPLTQSEVLEAMERALPEVRRLFIEVALRYVDDPATPARRATSEYARAGFDPDEFIAEFPQT